MAKAREYPVDEMPKSEPVHPGEVLREDVFPALGLNVTEAARELRVSRQTLHRVLAGTMAVSPFWGARFRRHRKLFAGILDPSPETGLG